GEPRAQQRGQGARAALGDARLRPRPPRDDRREGELHHALPRLRAAAGAPPGEGRRPREARRRGRIAAFGVGMSANQITPVGAERLRRELEYLQRVERPKIVNEVAYAASLGDRSENAEYIYGKKR